MSSKEAYHHHHLRLNLQTWNVLFLLSRRGEAGPRGRYLGNDNKHASIAITKTAPAPDEMFFALRPKSKVDLLLLCFESTDLEIMNEIVRSSVVLIIGSTCWSTTSRRIKGERQTLNLFSKSISLGTKTFPDSRKKNLVGEEDEEKVFLILSSRFPEPRPISWGRNITLRVAIDGGGESQV